ncbi:MAG: hypothetical protein FWD76_03035 [Firmicutes bacterium]|nr:hypothetical protein [Bacillota bacterium]
MNDKYGVDFFVQLGAMLVMTFIAFVFARVYERKEEVSKADAAIEEELNDILGNKQEDLGLLNKGVRFIEMAIPAYESIVKSGLYLDLIANKKYKERYRKINSIYFKIIALNALIKGGKSNNDEVKQKATEIFSLIENFQNQISKK